MRLISTILLDGSNVVTTNNFMRRIPVGTLTPTISNLDQWLTDEIFLLDINGDYNNLIFQLASLDRPLTSPLTAGGGIKSLDDAIKLVKLGADRICIQDIFFNSPFIVSQIRDTLGTQSLVLNIAYDSKESSIRGFYDCALSNTLDLFSQIRSHIDNAINLGITDIVLWSVVNDGCYTQRDLTQELSLCTKYPEVNFIIGGGITLDVIELSQALSNVSYALGNLLYYHENIIASYKSSLLKQGFSLRSIF